MANNYIGFIQDEAQRQAFCHHAWLNLSPIDREIALKDRIILQAHGIPTEFDSIENGRSIWSLKSHSPHLKKIDAAGFMLTGMGRLGGTSFTRKPKPLPDLADNPKLSEAVKKISDLFQVGELPSDEVMDKVVFWAKHCIHQGWDLKSVVARREFYIVINRGSGYRYTLYPNAEAYKVAYNNFFI